MQQQHQNMLPGIAVVLGIVLGMIARYFIENYEWMIQLVSSHCMHYSFLLPDPNLYVACKVQ